MKCVIPEISYHNRDPVLSCDFQPSGQGEVVRLATGGSDTHVVIWSVSEAKVETEADTEAETEDRKVDLEVLCDLTRHQRAVNIVRWSPDGSLLASGDDESIIIVWTMKAGQGEGGGLFDDEEQVNKENWTVYKIIRFHLDDVYDLSWSPCGEFLLSGSVDNTAIVSNVHKNVKVNHFSDSRGYIQGVCWNKKHPLLSTLGSDRTCRSYSTGPNKKLLYKTYKSTLNMKPSAEPAEKKKKKQNASPNDDANVADNTTNLKQSDNMEVVEKHSEPAKDNAGQEVAETTEKSSESCDKKLVDKTVRLFHDDTFKGFFRRLSWSHDGELLVVPSGVVETEGDTKVNHCTWVFTRVDLSKPALCLPAKDKYTIAVRFSPLVYALRQSGSARKSVSNSGQQPWIAANSLFSLPYRMVYAVATQNAVMFYDTQQAAPFARVCNIHYTGLTDLTWSPCGNILLVSSSDGYCSIITFTPGELGQEYLAPVGEKCSPQLPTEDVSEKNIKDQSEKIVPDSKQNALPVPNFSSEARKPEINGHGVQSLAQVQIKSSKEGGKANPKRAQLFTLSSPKADKKSTNVTKKRSKGQEGMDSIIERYGALGHQEEEGEEAQLMEVNDDLSLVLEESQAEAPVIETNPPVVEKKRVPLTMLSSGGGETNKPPATATPEKSNKGRRVSLITLSSPRS